MTRSPINQQSIRINAIYQVCSVHVLIYRPMFCFINYINILQEILRPQIIFHSSINIIKSTESSSNELEPFHHERKIDVIYTQMAEVALNQINQVKLIGIIQKEKRLIR